MVVVNPHNVAWLIYFNYAICKCLIHAAIILPALSFVAAVGGLVLFVVKKRVEVMLGIPTPSSLVTKGLLLILGTVSVAKPDWNYSAVFVLFQSVLQILTVLGRQRHPIA